MGFLCFCLFLAAVSFCIVSVFYYIDLRGLRIDLGDYLQNLIQARDASSGKLKVHFTAQVHTLKSILGNYFRV